MKLFNILLAACVVFLVLGLADVGNAMVSGFCRAMGAVLFIVTFVTRVVQKAEATQ
jgi:hypothetical protein